MFYWFTAFRTCIQYLYKNHLFYHQSFHSFCNIVFFYNVLMNTDRQSPFTHSSRITPLHCIFTAPCLVFKGTCAIQTVCLPTMCCLKRVVGKKIAFWQNIDGPFVVMYMYVHTQFLNNIQINKYTTSVDNFKLEKSYLSIASMASILNWLFFRSLLHY